MRWLILLAACSSASQSLTDPGVDLAAIPRADLAADPNGILGTFAGPCGALPAELHASSPSLIEDTLELAAGESWGRDALSADGQRLFDLPNAGGSSTESEVMSFEVLHHCWGAHLVKSETEISYAPPDVDAGGNIITDILVGFGGDKVGVSVTRAYQPGGMSDPQIQDLLVKKLDGINHSSARVLPADRWLKQILHVFVATDEAAQAVARIWPTLDASIRADTIVLVTRTVGGGFLYCNPDPPLGQDCP